MRPLQRHRPFDLRRWTAAGGALALLVMFIWMTSSPPDPARAATSGQLRQQIAAGRRRISGLSGTVAAQTQRLHQLDAGIASIQSELDRLQTDLSAKRAELLRLRAELSAAHVRLSGLIATETSDEQVLAAQLVGSYEGSRPNLVSVVLDSTGFNDLLDSLDFISRVGRQDTRITTAVRSARRAVAAQAVHLGALETRQQTLTDGVLSERNRVAAVRISLVSQQLVAARTQAATSGQLAGAQGQVASLSTQLSQLQAAQRAAAQQAAHAAAVRAAAAAAAQRAAAAPAPVASGPTAGSGPAAPAAPAPPAPAPVRSSGGFSFPLPISAAGPPSTWSPDDGVDITAPGGTPEYAVCSGTVVLHGIGGFGPSAPVIHCDSPLDGYSYVYYGHAGPGNWTPIGTHVSQGQVISEIGYGDVGISTGPHLEIGFADSSGNPIGPSSAGTMLALLHGAY